MTRKSLKVTFSALAMAISVFGVSSALAEGGMFGQLQDSLGAGKDAASGAAGAATGAEVPVSVPTNAAGTAVDSTAGSGGSSLVDSLTSKLGVTPEQAQGGAGSLFETAKKNLDAESFQQIADVVPGMDGMLGAAPKTEAGGLTGSLGGLGGDSAGGTMDLASLTSSFEQLGLSSDMVGKFAPVVVDYVKSQGGETVASLLSGALPGL